MRTGVRAGVRGAHPGDGAPADGEGCYSALR